MKRLVIAGLLLSGSALAAHADECGKVSLADMTWNSATLIANVDKFIMEHGYGCEVELVSGGTMSIGASMTEKGEPDVAPEFWVNSMREVLDKAVEEGRMVVTGVSLADGGEEGFWVPKYMVEKDASLATIEGVVKSAKMFPHPEDDSLSGFYGCPSGWNCQISGNNLFQALKLSDAGFDIVDPGSGAGLAGSIAKAYEREEGWFGYYWAPTAVLGKYEMVKVDFGSGTDDKMFKECITQEGCADPKPTMYPASEVWTLTTGDFAKKNPAINEYLSKRSYKNADMNKLLAWMEDNQADGEGAGINFLKEHKDKWSAWLPEDVAAKVEKALADY